MGESSLDRRALFVTASIVVAVIAVVAFIICITRFVDPKAQQTPPAGPLEIVKATWRANGRPDFDATAKVASLVRDGELHIMVNAAALGAPASPPGVVGTLVLTYRLNGVEQTTRARGGGNYLDIDAPSPSVAAISTTSPSLSVASVATGAAPATLPTESLQIIKAIWQMKDLPDTDVTEKIAALVKDGGLHVQVNWEKLGTPKPPQGATASLALTYRLNGVEHTRTTKGGGTKLDIGAPPTSPPTIGPPPVAGASAPTTTPSDPSPAVLAAIALARGGLPAGTLRIIYAVWQVKDQPDVDVTDRLAGIVQDGVLQTRVGAAALGLPGPPPGVTGNLLIIYNINGTEVTRNVRGGGTNLTIVAVDAGPTSMPATALPIAEDAKAFANTIEMKFVRIAPGEFVMGSPDDEKGRDTDEGPQHKVRISKSYFLQTTEVTQKQWMAVMPINPSSFQGDDLPVERVTWADAVLFCRKLGEIEGRRYRLPTEAEWEYACRAGTTGPIPAGAKLDDVAWHKGNSDAKSHPVGTKQPNPWGLYDILGNVVEWCSDWYGPYTAEDAVDPTGPGDETLRVNKGGSWYVDWTRARAADRHGYPPVGRFASNVGFRVVLEAQ